MTAPAAAAPPAALDDTMPKGIAFIVANEFAERFCYYGINCILSVYMVKNLHFGEAQATVWQSLFKFAAYFFPLLGAIISDVFWGKFRTIMVLALVYCVGCATIAFGGGPNTLALGLLLMALGTGGIKPCVSTNVGDQFTAKNQHLIERAFSYFYMAINFGSFFSIYFCPVWLEKYGPLVAFGIPASMMFVATFVFWLGRKRFVVVPPAMTQDAGRAMALFGLAMIPAFGSAIVIYDAVSPTYRTLAALFALVGWLVLVVWVCLNTPLKAKLPPQLRDWLVEAFTGAALKQITGLAIIYYLFVAMFWSLWDQSNGQTWTLQATSDLMDKHLFGFLGNVPGFSALASFELLPAQVQVVNGVFILGMVPLFSFAIYPLLGRFFTVTPLRKIGLGLWVIAGSYLIVAQVEDRIMHGQRVSLWWQILAYLVLSAAEVLCSITAMEFSYKQAPLKVKSFIMAATYLLSISIGNAFTAQVNSMLLAPVAASAVETGAQTWVSVPNASAFTLGQKLDVDGETGVTMTGDDGKPTPLAGTFLVAEVDPAQGRLRLTDTVHRGPVRSEGTFQAAKASVSTYRLVGPEYFYFFAGMAALVALIFLFVAGFYKERTHVREDAAAA